MTSTSLPSVPPPRDARVDWCGAFSDPNQAEAALVALGTSQNEYLALVRMHEKLPYSVAKTEPELVTIERNLPDRISATRMLRVCVDRELGKARRVYGTSAGPVTRRTLGPVDVRVDWRGALRDCEQSDAVFLALGLAEDDIATLVRMHGDVHDAVAISGDPWIADDRDTPDRILAARIINTCVRLGVLADESAGA